MKIEANTIVTPCFRCRRPEVKVYSRGLCKSCYIYVRTKINEGKTTDEQMVEKGWMLPRGAQGRPIGKVSVEQMKTTEGGALGIMEQVRKMEEMLNEVVETPPLTEDEINKANEELGGTEDKYGT